MIFAEYLYIWYYRNNILSQVFMGCESSSDPIEQAVCNAVNWTEWEHILHDTTESLAQLESEVINVEKLEKTMEFIWNQERLSFVDYFNLAWDPNWFVSQVREIQAALNFPENDRDGVIGPYTLSQIYLHYYAADYENLPLAQKNRLDTYEQMQNYPDRNVYNAQWEFIRTISVSRNPNVFDDRRYWGWESFDRDGVHPVDSFRAREGTMFANGILDAGFDVNRVRQANAIYIEKFAWKHILSMYNERGECELVTYTSPWDASVWANGSYEINASQNTNMHHMSNDLDGAPMPYGINVSDWNIMIHSTVWVVNGDYESAWCFRVALAYQSHIFHRVKEMWDFTLSVNV